MGKPNALVIRLLSWKEGLFCRHLQLLLSHHQRPRVLLACLFSGAILPRFSLTYLPLHNTSLINMLYPKYANLTHFISDDKLWYSFHLQYNNHISEQYSTDEKTEENRKNENGDLRETPFPGQGRKKKLTVVLAVHRGNAGMWYLFPTFLATLRSWSLSDDAAKS